MTYVISLTMERYGGSGNYKECGVGYLLLSITEARVEENKLRPVSLVQKLQKSLYHIVKGP